MWGLEYEVEKEMFILGDNNSTALEHRREQLHLAYIARRDIRNAQSKAWRNANPERVKVLRDRSRNKNPERTLLAQAKYRAKRLGLDFNLTVDDIHIPIICPVLGLPLTVLRTGNGGLRRKSMAPSIDRIDNSKGYITGNVIVVSARANVLKNDATVEELLKLATFYSTL